MTENKTPDEGEWPKRDAVPYVAMPVFDWSRLAALGAVATQGVREAEVTPEMVAGARVAFEATTGSFAAWTTAVYRAMAELAPVPLVSDGELAAVRERDRWREAALNFQAELLPYAQETGCPAGGQIDKGAVARARERDAAYTMRNETMDALVQMRQDRDAWAAQCAALVTERDEAMKIITTMADTQQMTHEIELLLRAELAAALDLLVQQRIAVKTPTSKPVPNPFREHRSDPRRIGGGT